MNECVGRDDRWEDREYDFLDGRTDGRIGGREGLFYLGLLLLFGLLLVLFCFNSTAAVQPHAVFLIYILPALILWPVFRQTAFSLGGNICLQST